MQRVGLSLLTILLSATFASAQSNAKAMLVKRLPAVKFDQIGLSDAIDFFRDATDGNFVVDWKALDQIGVGKDAVVNVQLRNVATAVALKKTLESAAPKLLTFYIDQNVVTITTQAAADAHMVTRLYAVEDLILEIPNFTDAPTFDLSSSQNTGGGQSSTSGGGGGGGGQSLFSGGGGNSTQTTGETKTAAERGQDLIDLIESTIRPEIWNTNGGKASIKYFNGKLIITAPAAVQDLIG